MGKPHSAMRRPTAGWRVLSWVVHGGPSPAGGGTKRPQGSSGRASQCSRSGPSRRVRSASSVFTVLRTA
eukprot:5349118-Alexandrium_andersonii.AAC.1